MSLQPLLGNSVGNTISYAFEAIQNEIQRNMQFLSFLKSLPTAYRFVSACICARFSLKTSAFCSMRMAASTMRAAMAEWWRC